MIPDTSRRLAAVWFADIVAFTTLAAKNEPAALKLVSILQRTVQEQLAGTSARVVKFLGDGALAEFKSTETAVRSALVVQQLYQERARAAGLESSLRIGVHVGDVVGSADGDLYGDGVNIAARLQAAAAPGQVVITEDVWRQLRQRPEYEFEHIGERELKGVAGRIALYSVTPVGGVMAADVVAQLTRTEAARALVRSTGRRLLRSRVALIVLLFAGAGGVALLNFFARPPASNARLASPAAGAGDDSTAAHIDGSFLVIPFRNLSGSAEYDWLTEGSTSLLTDILGQWREISVVSPERMHAALQNNKQKVGSAIGNDVLSRMAQQTNARSIVTGELLRAGDSLMVNARVYDAVSSRLVIDAKEKIGPGEDARAAFERLAIRLLQAAGLDATSVDLRSVTTQSLDAYKAYTLGVGHFERDEIGAAEQSFQKAVRLDSTFAQAWARLAVASLQRFDNLLDPRSAGYTYAARAAALSVRLPERQRRFIQALDGMYRGRFGAARREFDSLLAADSMDSRVLEALVDLEFGDMVLVKTHGQQRPRGSYNRAVALAQRVLAMNPDRPAMYQVLATLYTRLGEPRPSRTLPPSAIVSAYAEEGQLAAQLGQMDASPYRAILRDTIEFILLKATSRINPDSMAHYQAHARAEAKNWIDRWLSVEPREAAAHAAAARLALLEQDVSGASGAQTAAENLAAADEHSGLVIRRVTLLGRQGRYREARALADSLRRAGYFDDMRQATLTGVDTDGFGWAFALYLMHGDSAGVNSIVRTWGKTAQSFVPILVARGIFKAPKDDAELVEISQLLAITLLSSTKEGDINRGQIASAAAAPPQILLAALDTLLARPTYIPRGGWAVRAIPTVFDYAAFASDSASAKQAAHRALDLAFVLAKEPANVKYAGQLARSAIAVDPSLHQRVASAAWFQADHK